MKLQVLNYVISHRDSGRCLNQSHRSSSSTLPATSLPEDAIRFVALSFAEAFFCRGILDAKQIARERSRANYSLKEIHICAGNSKPEHERSGGLADTIAILHSLIGDDGVGKRFLVEIPEFLRRLSLSIHHIDSSRVLDDILSVIPILIQLKRRILIGFVGSMNLTAWMQVLIGWLNAVSEVLGKFQKIEESRHVIQFICDRLIEINISTDSIKGLIIDGLQSEDCEMLKAVFRLCTELMKCRFENPRVEMFVQSIASRTVSASNLVLHDCPEVSKYVSNFLNFFGSVDSFVPFRFSQFLVQYFSGNGTDDSLCSLVTGLSSVSVKKEINKFISREMGFQSQALQIWNRRRVPPTEKTNSDPFSLSLRIVPKLALPGFSEHIMGDDENQGISELYSVFRFVTLPLLRERFIELAVENIYRGNKLTLDLELVDQFPLLSRKEPILYHFFKLGQWMVQKCTPEEILSVSQKLQDKGYSIFRNLLFNKRKFHDENLTFLGSGQFGSVHKTTEKNAIKIIRAPSSESDRCTFHDSLNEAACHSLCASDSFCVPLISCGQTDQSSFFLEIPLYSTSLSKWRSAIPAVLEPLPLLRILIVFSEILSAVEFLHDQVGIIHYDLKMDNILLDYGTFNGTEPLLIPKVGVSDFGEARIVHPESEHPCLRNRGTECIKSPEMLSIASKIKKDGPGFDRRKIVGTGAPSDIWSIGCLFFQLVTGQYLFDNEETDWLQFYYRVTGDGPILNQRDRASLNHNQSLIEFLESLLVRDPGHRPNIKAVIRKFQKLYVISLKCVTGFNVELPPSIPGILKLVANHSH